MHIDEMNPDGQSLFNHSNSNPFEIEQQSKASSLLDPELIRRIEKEVRESVEMAMVKKSEDVLGEAVARVNKELLQKIISIDNAYATKFFEIKNEIVQMQAKFEACWK